MDRSAASGMAVRDGRIAVAYKSLNRLGTEGSSPRRGSGQAGGLPLEGPKTSVDMRTYGRGRAKERDAYCGPSSMAFSPDGKTLYMTGFMWDVRWGAPGCLQAVLKMDYEKNAEPAVFVGNRKIDGEGDDNAHFSTPSSVACDSKGRVYVSDFLNNRVQVFSPRRRSN